MGIGARGNSKQRQDYDMRKTASEMLRDLEVRIARLERESAYSIDDIWNGFFIKENKPDLFVLEEVRPDNYNKIEQFLKEIGAHQKRNRDYAHSQWAKGNQRNYYSGYGELTDFEEPEYFDVRDYIQVKGKTLIIKGAATAAKRAGESLPVIYEIFKEQLFHFCMDHEFEIKGTLGVWFDFRT
jgi:hypothetical protein